MSGWFKTLKKSFLLPKEQLDLRDYFLNPDFGVILKVISCQTFLINVFIGRDFWTSLEQSLTRTSIKNILPHDSWLQGTW
jgi:Ni,Fe-hydrogenase I cytochrome b subunit